MTHRDQSEKPICFNCGCRNEWRDVAASDQKIFHCRCCGLHTVQWPEEPAKTVVDVPPWTEAEQRELEEAELAMAEVIKRRAGRCLKCKSIERIPVLPSLFPDLPLASDDRIFHCEKCGWFTLKTPRSREPDFQGAFHVVMKCRLRDFIFICWDGRTRDGFAAYP